MLGLPNITPSSNAKTVELMKRRHSITHIESHNLKALQIYNTGASATSKMNESRNITEEYKPFGIEVVDAPITPITPISNLDIVENPAIQLRPQFRRRHSVSDPRSFARKDLGLLFPSPMADTIEERRSMLLDKSTVLE